MEKKCRRTIVLLVGACLWTFYIFQEEMADFGLYTLISYSTHEIASLIPILSFAVTMIWGICLVVRLAKGRADRADKIFLAILLVLTLVQRDQIWKRETYSDAVATVESVDNRQGTMTVQIGEEKTVILETPEIVRGMVETDGQRYLISYTWDKRIPGTGQLNMIQRIEE